MAWPSEIPIKDEDWWVNTSMECWAESDGDQTILHVKTYPANPGSIHLPEYINWTIINGNVSGNASYYIVNVIWTEFPDNKQSYEVNITIDDEGTEDFNLGYIQKLQMKLRYVDGTRSPGQKEYWIETDLDDIGGPPVDKSEQWHNWTDNWDECGQLESDGPHNLTWWTDYNGYNETIENATFHINTKVLAEVEALDGDLVLHVTVFGQSNYNDEIIKYTVGNGDDIGSDAYCYVTITGDDISTWTSENLVDGDFDFEELGNVQKPLSLTVYYMDPC